MRSTLPLFTTALALAAPALAAEVVPVPQFRAVELRGGGGVTMLPGPVERVTILEGSTQFTRMAVDANGKLQIDTCAERCPINYRLRVEIRSPGVPTLAVRGGGVITAAAGFAPQGGLVVAVSGGGVIDARAVPAETVTAAVSGGGEVLVQARRALTAAVNGGGHVRYWGSPQVTTAIRGGGAVSRGS